MLNAVINVPQDREWASCPTSLINEDLKNQLKVWQQKWKRI